MGESLLNTSLIFNVKTGLIGSRSVIELRVFEAYEFTENLLVQQS